MNERDDLFSLESSLRQALEREPAPPGFADRVIARSAQSAQGAMARSVRRRPVWRMWAAAAGLVVLLGGAWQMREAAERRRGEEASRELVFALRTASAKLQLAQDRIVRNYRRIHLETN